MAREIRRFYLRYHLLTVIAPAYLTAAIFYGMGWLVAGATALYGPASYPAALVAFTLGTALLFPLYQQLAGLGFLATGVPLRRVIPTAEDESRLNLILQLPEQTNPQTPALSPVLLELGPVPYIAVSGSEHCSLWISTQFLRRTPAGHARCMVAHETGHVVTTAPDFTHWLHHSTWLLACPLAVILVSRPELYVAAALLHTLVWLRLTLWESLAGEARADAWAITVIDRRTYIRALAKHLQQVHGRSGRSTTLARLKQIGLAEAEIEQALNG